MPSIIFINRYFHPDLSATSQMLSDLAFGLAERGWRVRVITSRQLYQAAEEPLAPAERIGGVSVTRVWTTRFGRGRLLGRAVDYITFYIFAAIATFRQTKAGDIVVAKTDPPMLSVVIAPVTWWRGAVLVNWLQDLFPEVAEALGVGRGGMGRLGFAVLRRLRNRTLRRARANVVLGERMVEHLAAQGIGAGRSKIIANWADGAIIRPVDRRDNALRRDWGLNDTFVVGYSGNLGRAHEFATLVGAIDELERYAREPATGNTAARRDGAHAVRWLMIGGGALHERLEADIGARGLTSVMFKPYQPRERLAESLSAADVHLVSLRPDMEGLIVPSKIYGILAAGRPAIFVGDPDGEVARLLARAQCGTTVAEGDAVALAAAVRELARHPDLAERQGRAARAAFDASFDRIAALDQWDALLKTLAGQSALAQDLREPGLSSARSVSK